VWRAGQFDYMQNGSDPLMTRVKDRENEGNEEMRRRHEEARVEVDACQVWVTLAVA